MTTKKQIATVDFDSAYNVSTGCETMYFAVAQNRQGWWMTAVWDNAHAIDTYVQDDGPYKTEREAQLAGINAATQWMADNDLGAFEIDSRLIHLANL